MKCPQCRETRLYEWPEIDLGECRCGWIGFASNPNTEQHQQRTRRNTATILASVAIGAVAIVIGSISSTAAQTDTGSTTTVLLGEECTDCDPYQQPTSTQPGGCENCGTSDFSTTTTSTTEPTTTTTTTVTVPTTPTSCVVPEHPTAPSSC